MRTSSRASQWVAASEGTLAARRGDQLLIRNVSTHRFDLDLEAGICFSTAKAPVLVIDERFVALQACPA
jgi:hypothetical protein